MSTDGWSLTPGLYWEVVYCLVLTHALFVLSSSESFLEGDPFSNLGEMPNFDFSPLSSSDFLLDRNGECLSLPLDGFINISPPHSHDYHFGLEDNEGISELFDCDFGDLKPLEF